MSQAKMYSSKRSFCSQDRLMVDKAASLEGKASSVGWMGCLKGVVESTWNSLLGGRFCKSARPDEWSRSADTRPDAPVAHNRKSKVDIVDDAENIENSLPELARTLREDLPMRTTRKASQPRRASRFRRSALIERGHVGSIF